MGRVVPGFIDKSKLKGTTLRYIDKRGQAVALKKGSNKKVIVGSLSIPKKKGHGYYIKNGKIYENKLKNY